MPVAGWSYTGMQLSSERIHYRGAPLLYCLFRNIYRLNGVMKRKIIAPHVDPLRKIRIARIKIIP